MCQCGDANDAAKKKTEKKPGACAACEAAKTGSVKWVKDPGATEEDVKKAQAAWEEAKAARHPDGSKPQTVKAMEALEASDKTTTIHIMSDASPDAADGNAAGPANAAASRDGTGSDAAIWFNPNDDSDYADGTERKPSVSVAHEAQHAYEYTQGTAGSTREEREKSATAAENEHRHTQGMKQRDKYGEWDVEKYEPPAE